MQKLIMPFRKSIVECGYKVKRYKSYWGFDHYGIDITVTDGIATPEAYDHTVYASGDGTVVYCEYDKPTGNAKSLGWQIAVRYDNCVGRDGSVKSLIARYMHCHKAYVGTGAKVVQGQRIAEEGSVGTKVAHLHFELDTDTKNPLYTPQVSAGHSGWKKGYTDSRDTTVNPSLWLWQSSGYTCMPYPFTDRSWITTGVDDHIPFADSDSVEKLKAENAELRETLAELRETLAEMRKLIAQLSKL